MNLLAERTPLPNGLIVFVALGVAADLAPGDWGLLFAVAALLVLPLWWLSWRRREARIAEVRALMACDPLHVRVWQMEEPW